MTLSNEIFRTRVKLSLMDTAYINWLLGDMINLVLEMKIGESSEGKKMLIDCLKNQYLEFLEKNAPKDGQQGELFDDTK